MEVILILAEHHYYELLIYPGTNYIRVVVKLWQVRDVHTYLTDRYISFWHVNIFTVKDSLTIKVLEAARDIYVWKFSPAIYEIFVFFFFVFYYIVVNTGLYKNIYISR